MNQEQKLVLPALNEVKKFVNSELEKVNSLILSSVESHAELIPTITSYLTGSGGKRLRPLLTLASAKILGIKDDAHIKLATAVEYIHTATLLHDDVIDESDLRRGKKTANSVWGNKASILVGDYLLSQSFKLMVQTGSIKALAMLATTAGTITESEIWQLELIKKVEMSFAEYIDLVKGKTAVLFAASCSVGAVAMDLPKDTVDSLYAYGLNLGICFQILDDVLDYFSDTTEFGKSLGNDLIEGKITIPLIYAYQSSSSENKEFIVELVNNGNPKKHEVEKLYKLFAEHQVYERVLSVAREYAEEGAKCLMNLDDKYNTQLLKDIILEQPKRAC